VSQDDVQVTINGHMLTIRSREPVDGHEDGDWIVREHSPAQWERTLKLPHEVDGSAVTAAYKDGMLELELPKAEPAAQRQIPVQTRS
jgi:HSP20 family protein